jgi:hypothetical protein
MLGLALLTGLATKGQSEIIPLSASGDIRVSLPMQALPGPFSASPDSDYWPQPIISGQPLTVGQTLHLASKSVITWKTAAGQMAIFRGPGHARIEQHSIDLRDGNLWIGTGPETQLVLRLRPGEPARGRIIRLEAKVDQAVREIFVRSLPSQGKTSLHLDSRTSKGASFSAFLALARNDWRRELRLELTVVTAHGRLMHILTLPVAANSETPLDRQGIFGRTAYIQPIWHWRPAPEAFPLMASVLTPQDRIAWREPSRKDKGFPAWSKGSSSPAIWLPPEKQALLADRAGIQYENSVHWRATSWDTPEILWKGPFIIPAWHRYSSPFSETRTFVGLGTGVHLGIDIAAFFGTAVAAPNNGIVRFAGKTTLCGNNVIIDHGRRVFTKIMHLDSLYVVTGQRIERGQPIGMTGTSGLSSGPHIHWEMLVGSVRVDPEEWVAMRDGGLQ